MLIRRLFAALLISALVILSYGTNPTKVRADSLACSADTTPSSVNTASTTNFELHLNNTGTNSINFIRITQPTADFNIMDASASGWGAQGGGSQISLQNGSISSGDSLDISFPVESGTNEAASTGWIIEASNDLGNTTVMCEGAHSVAISNIPPESIPPIITGISLSNLSSIGVSISWSTNEIATTQIHYGLTNQYGSTSLLQTAMTTSHSAVIGNLTANTNYHFKVISTDSDGNTATSNDSTFLTPLVGQFELSLPLINNALVKKTPTETVPPTIKLTSDFSKPQKSTPTISGVAEDNEAVAGIFYSVDGGKNWLPVGTAVGLGSKKVNFSFTPLNLRDGNYEIILSVVDTSSNHAQTEMRTIIIDRLPPTVGTSVITIGVQVLVPDTQNVIHSLVGVDQKITLNAVGGPISIIISTTKIGSEELLQSFNLTQSVDNGLWSGNLSYENEGTYQLVVNSIDGAGNKTSRALSQIDVGKAGVIMDQKRKALDAKVTIYERDSETNDWVLWDGESYSQTNPSKASQDKGYAMYLPEGTFYIKVEAPGFQTMVSRSFSFEDIGRLNENFVLKRKPGLDIGPMHIHMPWPSVSGNIVSKLSSGKNTTAPLLPESVLPQFNLSKSNGEKLNMIQLFGKPTILSFMNSWSGSMSSQMEAMQSITDPALNIIPISSGESVARLSSYANQAAFTIPILADTENELISKLGGSNMPITYFIDRHGTVKKIVSGLLSKEELLKNVSL